MLSDAEASVKRSVDIRDVAKKAGVSVGTVSRVVNGHPSVTTAKRERVQRAIAELRYRPDVFAQSLRKRTSNTIGVIIPDIRNPFFAELMQCIEIRARGLGYSVLFGSSHEDPEAEADHIEAFAARKVDGILLLPSTGATSARDVEGVPIIVVDRPIEGHPAVAADNRSGARLAAEYLLSLGHRRVACISGPKTSPTAKARLDGFLDVMTPHYRAAGLAIDDYVISCEFNYVAGQRAADALLSGPKPRPTAIFAGSDQQAIGALRAAADCGIAVPSELSVIGFDGILLSDLVTPRLTTIVQPVAKIAEAAVAILLNANLSDEAKAPILLECELVVRDSCAPAPLERAGRSVLRQNA
jgi:LacI family transcriptional regulator